MQRGILSPMKSPFGGRKARAPGCGSRLRGWRPAGRQQARCSVGRWAARWRCVRLSSPVPESGCGVLRLRLHRRFPLTEPSLIECKTTRSDRELSASSQVCMCRKLGSFVRRAFANLWYTVWWLLRFFVLASRRVYDGVFSLARDLNRSGDKVDRSDTPSRYQRD